MPKKTTRKKAAVKKSKNKHLPAHIKIILFCLLAIVFTVALSWLFDTDRPTKKIRGTANLSDSQLQTLSAQETYQSLDMRIAALAVYKGSSIKVVKDLGVYDSVKHRIISFPVYSANLTEYGMLALPKTPPPPGGYPVLILLHGYIDPAHYSTEKAYLSQVEYFTQHGFAVIKPDLRGQGWSKKSGKPEGAYYSMAYNVDVLSLIACLKQTPYLNKTNINVWGHSMGAYIAFRAAVLSPDIKHAILLAGAVGKFSETYVTHTPPSDRSNPVALLIKSDELADHGTPLSNPDFWENASVINFVQRAKGRFQIQVGLKDTIVDPSFSAELNDLLDNYGIPHEYYEYPEGGHGLGKQMPEVLSRSLAFLNSQNN